MKFSKIALFSLIGIVIIVAGIMIIEPEKNDDIKINDTEEVGEIHEKIIIDTTSLSSIYG